MKKLLALLFVASLGFAVVGCSGGTTDDAAAAAPATPKDSTPKAAED